MKGRLLPRRELTPSEEDAMYDVFREHFGGVTRDRFRKDLDEKNWVILLSEQPSGSLLGFSTLHFYERIYDGRPISVVYSGDTVVRATAWGRSVLSQAWIGSVNYLRRKYAKERLYWFLLVSGYRTYRFLSIYWRDFYPRHDTPTPTPTRDLMNFLARDRFGPLYYQEDGIVRFSAPQILRTELRGIPPGRLASPHIAFFARKNPGHERGDELVCLADLSYENLTPAGRRMWNAGERDSQLVQRDP